MWIRTAVRSHWNCSVARVRVTTGKEKVSISTCGAVSGRSADGVSSPLPIITTVAAGLAHRHTLTPVCRWRDAPVKLDVRSHLSTLRSLSSMLILLPALLGAQPSKTQIVILGTGTPIPDPDRTGPGVAIVVDSVAYLFDAGVGVVRRAAAAGRNGVKPFAPRGATTQPSPRFDRLFLTHLHSDHTLGVADVIFTPWIQGRIAPLDIYGPPGTSRLVNGILDGNAEDIAERLAA